MRYGVIGTGAIGGYYGAKLAQAGKEVHFLFHSDYDHVARHGLQVESCDGSFHLDHVNAYKMPLFQPGKLNSEGKTWLFEEKTASLPLDFFIFSNLCHRLA